MPIDEIRSTEAITNVGGSNDASVTAHGSPSSSTNGAASSTLDSAFEPFQIVGAPAPSGYLSGRRKRLLDVTLGVIGLTFTILILPFMWIGITLSSRGSIFYHQKRLGLNGQVFMVIKFRSMIKNAELGGQAVYSQNSDPRVHNFGKLLRKTYLDEFPQWLAVISGKMSTVGPRPERPELAEEIVKVHPDFEQRLLAKPGLTGLAQLKLGYGSSIEDSKEKLAQDIEYIKHASFSGDVLLIIKTLGQITKANGG